MSDPTPAPTHALPAAPTAPHCRLALADDHAVVRMGYRRLLELEDNLSIVAEYGTVDEAARDLLVQRRDDVDLLLLDLSMPGRSGIEFLRELSEQRSDLRVVVVTMHDAPAMLTQCLRAGAAGFVSKSGDPQVLVDTVLRIAAGGKGTAAQQTHAVKTLLRDAPHQQLTAREIEVLNHLLTGAGLEAIAQRMRVSEKTVSNYQTLIRNKLDVSNSVELVQYARTHGLIA